MTERGVAHEAEPPASATPLSEAEVAAVAEAWLAVSARDDEQEVAAFGRAHADRLVTQVGRLWAAMRDIEEHVASDDCACGRVGRIARAALRR